MVQPERGVLDVATDLTIAWIQSWSAPANPEEVATFFLEAFKTAFKADRNSEWIRQIREELGVE